MKKRNEGYALPFVLVVMVVLCLVAVAVMSFSLSNLKNQQASVRRMQDQYAAQGEIEKVVAKLASGQTFKIDELKNDTQDLEIAYDSLTDDQKEVLLNLTAEKGTVSIACQLKVTSDAPILTGVDNGTKIPTLTGPVTYKYLSYEISTVVPEGEVPDET